MRNSPQTPQLSLQDPTLTLGSRDLSMGTKHSASLEQKVKGEAPGNNVPGLRSTHLCPLRFAKRWARTSELGSQHMACGQSETVPQRDQAAK